MTPAQVKSLFDSFDDATRASILEPLAHEKLSLIDAQIIESQVLKAACLWLLEDLSASQMLVEEPFDTPAGKGIVDLALVHNGVCKIVDWKTTQSLLYPAWKTHGIASNFQTSMYLHAGGAFIENLLGVRPQTLEYRVLDDEINTRSFEIPYFESNHDTDIISQVASVKACVSALVSSALDVWPRARPHACFKGTSGSSPTCQFWNDCVNMTMPKTPEILDVEALVPRSKSSLDEFLTCPEHYRRTHVCGGERTETEAQLQGSMFHLMVSRLWKAAWNKHNKQKD